MSRKLKSVQVPAKFEGIFVEAESYVARYFGSRSENPEQGTIEISDERYLYVRAGAMSVDFFKVVRDLYSEDDSDEALSFARSLLFDIAHAIGLADANAFAAKTGLKASIERLSAGPIHFAYTGWASVRILDESLPSPDDDFLLVYDHPRSFESDSWLERGQSTDFPVCIMNSGYSSGWCEASFDIPLVASEILCRAKGDHACRFVMAPPERIEERIAGYLSANVELADKVTRHAIPGFFERKKREETLRLENLDLESRITERTEQLKAVHERLEADLEVGRRTQRELNESRSFHEQVVNSLPSGLLHLGPSGHILAANAEACRFLGLPSNSLVGRPLAHLSENIVLEERSSPTAGIDLLASTLATGTQHGPIVLGVRQGSNEIAWGVFNSVALRNRDNEVTSAIVTILDISGQKKEEAEHKRIEASLQEKQRLESLGILAGGVAHDFNNLLVGVMANASLARHRLSNAHEVGELLDRIEYAANQAAGLTEQMLAYAGQSRMELAPTLATSTVRQMLKLLQASMRSQIALHVEIDELAPAVLSDTSQLSQIVLNLVSNAAESIEGAGDVWVLLGPETLCEGELPSVDVGHELVAGDYLVFQVRDSGAGMTAETKGRIFEPFFSTKFSGRGLGMAAVAGIVRAHSGSLRIESRPGAGTRATLYLPALRMKVDPRMPAAKPTKEGSGKILIFDDNAIVGEALELMLADAGYEPLVASSRRTGLDLYSVHAAELSAVLLDWTMPGMPGMEAIEALRIIDARVPIVVMTGHALDSMGDWRGEILAKPFTEGALLEKLSVAIEGIEAGRS